MVWRLHAAKVVLRAALRHAILPGRDFPWGKRGDPGIQVLRQGGPQDNHLQRAARRAVTVHALTRTVLRSGDSEHHRFPAVTKQGQALIGDGHLYVRVSAHS